MKIYFQNKDMLFIGSRKDILAVKKQLEKEGRHVTDILNNGDGNCLITVLEENSSELYSIIVKHIPYIEVEGVNVK